MLAVAVVTLACVLTVPSSAFALVPVNLTPPVIGGTAQEGQDLSCSQGTWLGSPTSYAYQWKRNGGNIGGATGSTYEVQSADVLQLITCSVTASNADGPSLLAATSLPVTPVAAVGDGTPVNVLPPVITGAAMEGQQLSCSQGTWLGSPTSYAYQWKRNGSSVGAATSSTYTVQNADVAQQLTCSVVATNGAGASAAATSQPVVPIALTLDPPPLALLPPVIGGIARQGEDVTCSDGVWLGSPTSYAKQWQRGGNPIAGATGGTYTIRAADVGQLITCSVVASDGNDSQPSTSLPVVPVSGLALNTSKPQISGTPRPGQQLSCSNGSWSPAPDSFSRAWNRGGTAIAGATGSTYTVRSGDVGAQLTCTVTATNVFGDTDATSDPVTVTSNPAPAKPASSSRPVVSVVGGGAARPGRTLSCGRGGWTGSPTSFAYAWTRDGALVAAASGSTLRLGSGTVGRRFACRVSATNAGGTTMALSNSITVQRAAPSPGGAADRTAPVVSGFSMTRKRFVVRKRSVFRYRLSEAAAVTLRIELSYSGYRKGRRCRQVTPRMKRRLGRAKLRKGRCKGRKRVGTLRRRAPAGASKLPFKGRVGRRALGAGAYVATIVAKDAAGNSSRPRRTRFKVVKAKKRRRRAG